MCGGQLLLYARTASLALPPLPCPACTRGRPSSHSLPARTLQSFLLSIPLQGEGSVFLCILESFRLTPSDLSQMPPQLLFGKPPHAPSG